MLWGNMRVPLSAADITEFDQIDFELRHTASEPLQIMYRRLQDGDTEALDFLGAAYLFGGWGLHADIAKALVFLRLAAECGSTTAQYYLGDCCAFGIGMPENMSAARHYYRLAAQSTIPLIRESASQQLRALGDRGQQTI